MKRKQYGGGEYFVGARVRKRTKAAPRGSARGGYYQVPRTGGALVQTERKYFDTFLSGGVIAQTTDWTGTELDPAALNCLFVPSEGSDIDNRVGRKVTVLKQTIRGVIKMGASNAKTAAIDQGPVRLVWYVDTQTNGSQAQGEELMAAPGAATTELASNCFQNTNNFGRFQVLKDVTYRARPDNVFFDGTDGAANAVYIPFKLKRNWTKGLVVRFNATNGGSVADIIDNSMHLIGTAMNSDQTITLSYQVRTVYVDA